MGLAQEDLGWESFTTSADLVSDSIAIANDLFLEESIAHTYTSYDGSEVCVLLDEITHVYQVASVTPNRNVWRRQLANEEEAKIEARKIVKQRNVAFTTKRSKMENAERGIILHREETREIALPKRSDHFDPVVSIPGYGAF